MDRIKQIANELMEGEIEKAVALAEGEGGEARYEVIEVVRGSIVTHVKRGDFERVKLTIKLFSLSEELVDATLKQAVLSIYYDGNHELLVDIRRKLPLSSRARAEIVGCCETWGDEEVATMRTLFLS